MISRRLFVLSAAAALLAGPVRAQTTTRARGAQGFGVVSAPYEFTAVGTTSDRPIEDARVRVSADGATWSDWQPVTTGEAHGLPYHGDLLIVPPSRYAQCDAPAVKLHLIDPGPSPRTALGTPVSIVSRAGWGCDESLRFDSQGNEIWPAEPQVPVKVIVHHTATSDGGADPAAVVRSIYYYHAVSNGWGDIGYHYLVDWRGVVYEGRYGGRYVWAGHALQYNHGSIGIACIGNFDNATPTAAMRTALARLIAQVAPAIDPHDTGWFVDRGLANLSGHRDTGIATSCPGDLLYTLLPGLRGDVQFNIGNTPTPRASILDLRISPSNVAPGGTATVRATIQNTGTAVLATQDPTDAFLYDERDTYAGRGLVSRDACWRLGLDLSGGGAAGGMPFRWGLPQHLEPGNIVTVTGLIKMGAAGARTAGAQMVWENRATTSTGPVRAGFQVGSPPTPTATPSPTATPVPIPLPTQLPGYQRGRLPVIGRNATA